jgi:hypothetical protein
LVDFRDAPEPFFFCAITDSRWRKVEKRGRYDSGGYRGPQGAASPVAAPGTTGGT